MAVLFAAPARRAPGAPRGALWNAPRHLVWGALGRTAQGAGTTVPIDLVAPGEVWGDRVNEVNLRFAKVLRFGRFRTHAGIDIYNILNSNAILTYNQTYTPPTATSPSQWLAPQAVLTPRFLKVSAQIDF